MEHIIYVFISSIIGGIIIYEMSGNVLIGILSFGIINILWLIADLIMTKKILEDKKIK